MATAEQLANLKPPWKPGQSGNPEGGAGRPRKRPMTEEYDELLREPLPDRERKALGLPAGTTWARAMALARAREALARGGTIAAKEITDRVEGKAAQRIELSGAVSHAAEFLVVYAGAVPQLKDQQPPIDVQPEPAVEVEPAKQLENANHNL